MAQDTIILSPRAQRTLSVGGKFFTVVRSSAPFDVDLSGGARRTVNTGSKISDGNFSRIKFYETSGAANTIVYDAGDEDYSGDVQSQVASTYLFSAAGNYRMPIIKQALKSGFPTGWGYSTNSAPINLVSEGILLSGTNNGHARKQITIQNTTNGVTAPATNPDVIVFDSSGRVFVRLKANDVPYTWESSDDFYLLSVSADTPAGVLICNEIFYSGL